MSVQSDSLLVLEHVVDGGTEFGRGLDESVPVVTGRHEPLFTASTAVRQVDAAGYAETCPWRSRGGREARVEVQLPKTAKGLGRRSEGTSGRDEEKGEEGVKQAARSATYDARHGCSCR